MRRVLESWIYNTFSAQYINRVKNMGCFNHLKISRFIHHISAGRCAYRDTILSGNVITAVHVLMTISTKVPGTSYARYLASDKKYV